MGMEEDEEEEEEGEGWCPEGSGGIRMCGGEERMEQREGGTDGGTEG